MHIIPLWNLYTGMGRLSIGQCRVVEQLPSLHKKDAVDVVVECEPTLNNAMTLLNAAISVGQRVGKDVLKDAMRYHIECE